VATKARVRVGDLLTYGALVRALASRDLKVRYKQSALGPAWVVFQPLALLAAFTVGFRAVAHVRTGGVPYVLFALAGLAVWTYFQAVTMVATGSIVNNYPLVRWTACPRLALPLATLVSNLPSFLIPGVAAIIAAGVSGYLWVGSLLVPVLCVWLLLLVAAGALMLSAVTVRARERDAVHASGRAIPVARRLRHRPSVAGAASADLDQSTHGASGGVALESPRSASQLDCSHHLDRAHGHWRRDRVATFRRA
jgi:ABC-type polysaccharide/polyol phosphate export permease